MSEHLEELLILCEEVRIKHNIPKDSLLEVIFKTAYLEGVETGYVTALKHTETLLKNITTNKNE